MRNIREIIGISSMVVLLLIGCSGDDTNPKTEYMRGWVFAEFPISGATVSIFDSDRVQLNKSGDETYDEGTFLVGIKGLPKNFRVIATDGKEGFREFAAELKTDVNNFDPETDIIYVNAVTTMVSTYLDKHPEKTLDEATTIIKDFLKIPQTVDIGESLHNSGQYFSHMAFMAEAERNGGVNSFIEILLAELESDPTKTHPFYSTQLFAGDTSDIVTKIVDKIAEGAISSAGGKFFGWALKMFGTGGDYSEVQKTLGEIKTMIEELSNKINSIYEQLSAQITQTDYNIRIGQIYPLKSKIESTSEALSFLVTFTQSPENENWIASEKERIKRIIGEQILPEAKLINKQLVGEAGAEGLIKVWSRIVKNKHRFLGPDDSKQIQAQFDYFDALQLSLLALIIEYHHATDAPDQLIHDAIDQYKKNRAAQISMKPLPIPKDTIIETHTGLMIHPYDVWNALRIAYDPANTPYGYVAADAHTYDHIFFYARGEYNYNVQKLLGFNNWRMPTSREGKLMFWSGKGVGTWAISQGYPKDCIDEGNPRDCIEDDNLVLLMDSTPRPGAVPAQQYWKFQTKDGKILKAGEYPCYRGYSCAHTTIGGILIPVRSPGAGEFYYW